MKLTNSQLKQLIKEELQKILHQEVTEAPPNEVLARIDTMEDRIMKALKKMSRISMLGKLFNK